MCEDDLSQRTLSWRNVSLKSNIGMEWDKGILCMAWYYKGPRLEGFYLSALSNLPMGIHSAPVKGPGPASSHQRSFCRADRERTWWWMRTILAMIMTKETGDWANRSGSSQNKANDDHMTTMIIIIIIMIMIMILINNYHSYHQWSPTSSTLAETTTSWLSNSPKRENLN